MKIKYLFSLLLISFWTSVSLAQNVLNERVYLQTDKQVYLAGELGYIKLVTTIQDIPVSFSKVGYVELLDTSASQVQIKLNIVDGVGEGWIHFPSSLPTGYYRLVAYTKYMQNEGQEVFFEKNIGIINPLVPEDKTERTHISHPVTDIKEAHRNTFLLTTGRPVYSKRDKVELKLDNLPKDIHTLSIAVTGQDPVPVSGKVDLLRWKDKLKTIPQTVPSSKYMAEYEGHILSGKLINIETGQLEYNEAVTPFISFSGDRIRMFSGKIDKDANVSFYTKKSDGAKEVVSTLVNYSDRRYRVDVESPFIKNHKTKQLPILNFDTIHNSKLLDRSVALQVLYAYSGDSINRFNVIGSSFLGKPFGSYLLDEYTRFRTMPEVITEFVTFVRFRKIYNKYFLSVFRKGIGYSSGNTLVLIDGIPVFDHDIVYNYNPDFIKKLEVYQDTYILGSQIFDGVISMYTYNNDYPGLELGESTQFFDYEGTQAHRRFYAPSYETDSDKESRLPDFRHTLYWNPDVKTNGETSIVIPFYASDLSDNYTVVVEGLTKNGEVIYGTIDFGVR